MSFWSQSGLKFDTGLSMANYHAFFAKRTYLIVLARSIENSAFVALFAVLIAYPAAYFIAFKTSRHKMVWLILITLPFWTSYLLRVFAWKVILGYEGVINSALMSLGVIAAPLEFLLYNRFAVVLTLAHAEAAFAILPIYVSLEKVDRSLIEASGDLGESPLASFLRVTLPLTFPGIIAASLLVFIPTVGDYVTPSLVGGTSGTMIGTLIQSQFGRGNNWPLGSAIAVMSMVAIGMSVGAYLLAMRGIRKRLA